MKNIYIIITMIFKVLNEKIVAYLVFKLSHTYLVDFKIVKSQDLGTYSNCCHMLQIWCQNFHMCGDVYYISLIFKER